MVTFDFDTQLAKSHVSVNTVLTWLNSHEGVVARDIQDTPRYFYYGDILIQVGSTRYYIEVKCENYSTRNTPNFACERYSDLARQTNGGVWSTQATLYAHLFADGYFFLMGKHELKSWLNAHESEFKRFKANNDTYTSMGYLVPRKRVYEGIKAFKKFSVHKQSSELVNFLKGV